MLKEKIKKFLEWSGMPKTVFCRRINISPSALYRYLKGDLYLSEETEQKIYDYLGQFDYQI